MLIVCSLDDSVGHWQVMNHPSKSGWSRVLYSTQAKLMPWIPEPIVQFISKKALTEATGWLKREAEAEQTRQDKVKQEQQDKEKEQQAAAASKESSAVGAAAPAVSAAKKGVFGWFRGGQGRPSVSKEQGGRHSGLFSSSKRTK